MASEKSKDVYKKLIELGFPDEFCREVSYKYLNTDFTATRMLGFLYRISEPSLELIVDEMFAIISDRDRLIEKHQSEQAQAKISDMYRNGLE